MENNEDPAYSKPVQFNVKNVLSSFEITGMRETTLDGNAWLDETRRLQFAPDPEQAAFNTYATFSQSEGEAVHLLSPEKPMLGVKYAEEALPAGQLGAESNRIKREVNPEQVRKAKRGRKSQVTDNVDAAASADSAGQEFIIELSPMQIRTFIVYLKKA